MSSQPLSLTPSEDGSPSEEKVELGWPRQEVEIAKIVVRHLCMTGKRSCISDLLMLSESATDSWFEQEAIRYLQEQKTLRQENQPPKPRLQKTPFADD